MKRENKDYNDANTTLSIEPEIFISYSSDDKSFAHKLDASLSVTKLSIFIDIKKIPYAGNIPEHIEEAIKKSTHLLYVVSKNSQKSDWVKKELQLAIENKIQIIPIIIDNTAESISVDEPKAFKCIEWGNATQYSYLIRDIAKFFGKGPIVTTAGDISFYAAYYNLIHGLNTKVATVCALKDSSLFAGAYLSNNKEYEITNQQRWLWKQYFEDENIDDFQHDINILKSLFENYYSSTNGIYIKFKIFFDILTDFRELMISLNPESFSNCIRLGRQAQLILREIEDEFYAISISFFDISEDDEKFHKSLLEKTYVEWVRQAIESMSLEDRVKIAETLKKRRQELKSEK